MVMPVHMPHARARVGVRVVGGCDGCGDRRGRAGGVWMVSRLAGLIGIVVGWVCSLGVGLADMIGVLVWSCLVRFGVIWFCVYDV